MSEQSRLEYVTRVFFEEINISEILGVSARWEGDDVQMKIYVSKELSEDQKDLVEDTITEIIAQFNHGVFYDKYVVTPIENLKNLIHLAYRKK